MRRQPCLLLLWVLPLLLAAGCAQESKGARQDPAEEVCVGDPRYGVAITDGWDVGGSLILMGVSWYLDYSIEALPLPKGCNQALKIKAKAPPSKEKIAEVARARPGSHWIIGNEPNVPGQDDMTPEEYSKVFHDIRNSIKETDSTALVVAPEVLNFTVSCTGCGGFPLGREWVDGFRASYRSRYGQEPPVDVWSLHTYDLDWTRLPMLDYKTQVQQIEEFRGYVDSIPGHYNRPVWLTEFAVVWGFDEITWLPQANATSEAGGISPDAAAAPLVAHPVGDLRVDLMADYLKAMLGWLDSNSGTLNIQRWFVFSSHGHREPWATAPSGVALIQGAGQNTELAPLGKMYREWASSSGASR